MKKACTLLVAAVAATFSGCGGGSHTTTTPAPSPHRVTLSQECPAGHAFMGCASTGQPAALFHQRLKSLKSLPHGALKVPSGALFPDVSSWQASVGWGSVGSWQRAHGWPQGGVFKMGEGGSRDSWAGNNSRLLTRLHYWKSGYWFVRALNCTQEANDIIGAARDYGVILVDEDLEVPAANGYGKCLTPRLRAAGLKVAEYTSPGTNPGGVDTSQPLWQAEYGPSLHPLWNPVAAWQCTDGHFGCATYVPGIGYDDVNVDYGLSRLAGSKPPPPPDPFAPLLKQSFHFGKDKAREFNTAHTWKDHSCRVPVHRAVCVTSYAHLKDLTGRLYFVAYHYQDSHGRWHKRKHVDWSHNKGVRFAVMRHLMQTK